MIVQCATHRRPTPRGGVSQKAGVQGAGGRLRHRRAPWQGYYVTSCGIGCRRRSNPVKHGRNAFYSTPQIRVRRSGCHNARAILTPASWLIGYSDEKFHRRSEIIHTLWITILSSADLDRRQSSRWTRSRRSCCSCASRPRVAMGRASSRAKPIGSPVSSQ